MLKKRLIASLLCRNGRIVQSVRFKHTNVIGNAITAVDFFNTWAIDEIVLLDISSDEKNRQAFFDIIQALSKRCFVPLSVGGWVASLDDIQQLLHYGADKVIINSEAVKNPDFITEAATVFGSQCIIISIDVKMTSGKYEVFIDRGKVPTGRTPVEWALQAQQCGAGEIYLTSIDQDGSKKGYDLKLISMVSSQLEIPVIASGGVGNWEHLVQGIEVGKAQAVSAANIFHYTEHSTKKAKDFLLENKIDVRQPVFFQLNEPKKTEYITNYRV